jgi:hypothetical protein
MAEILRGVEVPIAATAGVRAVIERDDAVKDAIVGPMMGAEWPAARVFPNQDIAPDGAIRFGDLAFHVEHLGAGESPADSVWRLGERAAFVGDVVYAGMHAYLADGHAAAWLACLERLEREIAPGTTLYVGHGHPGGAELFGQQRRYIAAFTASVERHLGRAPADRRAAVVADMKRALPAEDLLFLMELSVDPFAAKIEAAQGRSPR